jgi:hypothetical protein
MKVDEMPTPIGTVKVGDTVVFKDFQPRGVDNVNNETDTQKIYAIWNEGGNYYLAFDKHGIDTYGCCWDGSGNIQNDIIKIIHPKITNWRKEIQC